MSDKILRWLLAATCLALLASTLHTAWLPVARAAEPAPAPATGTAPHCVLVQLATAKHHPRGDGRAARRRPDPLRVFLARQ